MLIHSIYFMDAPNLLNIHIIIHGFSNINVNERLNQAAAVL